MHIAVNGKQFQIGDSLRSHIETSIRQVAEKYFSNPIEATVTMTRDGAEIRADVSVHIGRGIKIHGQAQSVEPYAAFDSAGEKINKRLRRHKRRLRDHHQGGADPRSFDVQEVVLAAESPPVADAPAEDREEWHPVVVAEMATKIESLTVEEAVMRMEFADSPVLMFRSSAHGGLNAVFRRTDGNIGWIDPKGTAQD
jgi:ribosomal subunit interface protein